METFQDPVYIEMRNDSESDNYSENIILTHIVEKRSYIRGTVFDNVERKK